MAPRATARARAARSSGVSTAASTAARPRGKRPATPTRSSADTRLPLDLKAHLAREEVRLLGLALEQARYNQRQAAEQLGLSYHQLRGLLRKYASLLPTGEQEDLKD